MNKKAFIEDINPSYLLLSIIGGLITFFIAKRFVAESGGGGPVMSIISGLIGVVVCYTYLQLTDR